MGGERAKESWFSSFRWFSRNKTSEHEKAAIGILAFEVASLMSRIVKLWHCLSESEVARLREEVLKSVGIRRLVSEDENYLMDLVLNEIIEELVYIARSLVRLGKRCIDPTFHQLEFFFSDPARCGSEWSGWDYKWNWKKMEKKVKKMDRFISAMLQFSQEQEVLVELEQSLRRMRANAGTDRVNLVEFQQKVMIQREEVRNLQDSSPWSRTYDYTLQLLTRSLFTIIERVKLVFGTNQMFSSSEMNDGYKEVSSASVSRSHSFSALLRSSIHLPEGNLCRFYLPPLSDKCISSKKQEQAPHNSFFRSKMSKSKSKTLAHVEPFKGRKGCSIGGPPIHRRHESAVGGSMRISSTYKKDPHNMSSNRIYCKLTKCYERHRNPLAPPQSLGYAALALHYAKVIVLIEKLAQSPYPIGLDDKEDLYSMLPSSIKTALRSKVRSHAKSSASSGHDAALVSEWSVLVDHMLGWLAPLAHNTVKWHSERNFEKQPEFPGANVLLVQTLYFANQLKTEAAIIELLLGLCLENPQKVQGKSDSCLY